MVEAGILDGDTAVIERCDAADTGAIVVALIDDYEVTLKRLRRRGGSIALEPANKTYETRIFPPNRVFIDGADLWCRGAHALYFNDSSIRVEHVAGRRGERPWSPRRSEKC